MGNNISLTPKMLDGGEEANNLEGHEVEVQSNLDVDGKAELVSNLDGVEEAEGDSYQETGTEEEVVGQEMALGSIEDFQTHPLMLPPVLAKVFQNLSLKQLAKCRRVCNLWYRECLSTWRSTSTVSLVNRKFNADVFLNGVLNKPQLADDFTTFLDFWEDESNECSSKPFRLFRILHWTFGMTMTSSASPPLTSPPASPSKPVEDGYLELQRFWQQVGIHITLLSLQYCSFLGIEEVRKVIYLACPNLQQLSLKYCSVLQHSYYENGLQDLDNPFTYKYISNAAASYVEPAFGEHAHLKTLTLKNCLPDSWLQLLSHFSSLTTLNIYGGIMDPLHTPRLLEAVNIIRGRDNLKLPLDHVAPLSLDYKNLQASRDSFRLLEQFGFPLGQMQASLFSQADHVFIKSILRRHAHTLNKLVLSIRRPNNFLFPPGVDFKNVEILELRYGLCMNFHFLNNMPDLRRLDMSYPFTNGYREGSQLDTVFANTLAPEMADLQLSKLEELQIEYKMTENNLRRLVGWIPSLKKLKMPLDDVQLGIVCQNWTNLVELRDISDELTDEGLTRSTPNLAGVDRDEQPMIGQLQKLKRFGTYSQNLTVVSVLNGFLKMQNLKSVAISPEAHIGIQGEEALAAKGVRVLYRDEEDGDSDVDDQEIIDRFNNFALSDSD